MTSTIAFDVISDLSVTDEHPLVWSGKSTSPFCIIAGNISDDLRVVKQTLLHINTYYNGVFYISGNMEQHDFDFTKRNSELSRICKSMRSTVYLHQHVIIIDGIALVGINGWQQVYYENTIFRQLVKDRHQETDYEYLRSTIERLQRHIDVKKIVIVSNSIPGPDLYFGEMPEFASEHIPLQSVLEVDTEHKVSHWVYGTYRKNVNLRKDNIIWVCNPKNNNGPYWATRIEVEV